ncbi:MAG TPA: hypothetical protein VJS68_02145 [Thermoplasmata archaeon]|nr:hypothetical protein [Thermoplasmata archaeon]
MPRKKKEMVPGESPVPENPPMPEDDWVQSLKHELVRAQKSAGEKTGEDLSHRADLNRRLLQDLWEVHNQFEDASVHLTIEPSQTLFATFVEYPQKWAFRENFDFGAVKTIELKDRTTGWVGFTLRFWYYQTPEAKAHLRGIFEWCDGESYHKYTGWMRMMSQAILFDANEHQVNLHELHQMLKDVVVKWFQAHIDGSPQKFIEHLRERYPKGATYAKESYRG